MHSSLKQTLAGCVVTAALAPGVTLASDADEAIQPPQMQ